MGDPPAAHRRVHQGAAPGPGLFRQDAGGLPGVPDHQRYGSGQGTVYQRAVHLCAELRHDPGYLCRHVHPRRPARPFLPGFDAGYFPDHVGLPAFKRQGLPPLPGETEPAERPAERIDPGDEHHPGVPAGRANAAGLRPRQPGTLRSDDENRQDQRTFGPAGDGFPVRRGDHDTRQLLRRAILQPGGGDRNPVRLSQLFGPPLRTHQPDHVPPLPNAAGGGVRGTGL